VFQDEVWIWRVSTGTLRFLRKAQHVCAKHGDNRLLADRDKEAFLALPHVHNGFEHAHCAPEAANVFVIPSIMRMLMLLMLAVLGIPQSTIKVYSIWMTS
jgi:hypothetical protein